MRKKYLAFLLAGCMTAGVPSMAWAAEQTTEAVSEETSGGEAAPSEETAAAQTAMVQMFTVFRQNMQVISYSFL